MGLDATTLAPFPQALAQEGGFAPSGAMIGELAEAIQRFVPVPDSTCHNIDYREDGVYFSPTDAAKAQIAAGSPMLGGCMGSFSPDPSMNLWVNQFPQFRIPNGEGDFGKMSMSSNVGSTTPTSSGGGSSSGSSSKTAIVKGPNGDFVAWYFNEASRVWFEDSKQVELDRNGYGEIEIDSRFMAHTEDETIIPVSNYIENEYPAGVKIEKNRIIVQAEKRRWWQVWRERPKSALVTFRGIRKGFRWHRFKRMTAAQYERNESFWINRNTT